MFVHADGVKYHYLEKEEGGETALSSLRGEERGPGESPPVLIGIMYGEKRWCSALGEGRSGDRGEDSEELREDGGRGEGMDEETEDGVEEVVRRAAARKAGL